MILTRAATFINLAKYYFDVLDKKSTFVQKVK